MLHVRAAPMACVCAQCLWEGTLTVRHTLRRCGARRQVHSASSKASSAALIQSTTGEQQPQGPACLRGVSAPCCRVPEMRTRGGARARGDLSRVCKGQRVMWVCRKCGQFPASGEERGSGHSEVPSGGPRAASPASEIAAGAASGGGAPLPDANRQPQELLINKMQQLIDKLDQADRAPRSSWWLCGASSASRRIEPQEEEEKRDNNTS